MKKRFIGRDVLSILCPRDSRGRKNINTVPNSVIEYGPRIQGSKRLPAKYESSKCSSDHRVPASTINSLGSRLLDPVVRVFSVHSSRMLRLCRRSRGLIGIGSGVGWVSGMAGQRWGCGDSCNDGVPNSIGTPFEFLFRYIQSSVKFWILSVMLGMGHRRRVQPCLRFAFSIL